MQRVSKYQDSDAFWPYLAGFFDGEGSITSAGYYGRVALGLQITIAQKPREVLDVVVQRLAARDIKATVYGGTENRKHIHHIVIGGMKSQRRFLEGVLPWLIVKRIIAQDALRILKVFPSLGNKPAIEAARKVRAQRTTCRYGHPLTQRPPHGNRPATRWCLECRRRQNREHMQRRRDQRRAAAISHGSIS